MDLLPDVHWSVELGDLANLLVAAVGAYLAWLAIRMGREQTRIGKEQTQIAKRQEALDIEQGNIAKRQAEIAETQHSIMQDQLGRRAILAITLTFLHDNEKPLWRIRISNSGNRTATECNWNIYIPEQVAGKLYIQKWNGEQLHLSEDTYVRNGTIWRPFYGDLQKSIYPGSDVQCATIVVHPEVTQYPRLFFPITLQWSIWSEDGRYPKEGLENIELADPLSYYS
jgi:hypothetical protein